MIRRTWWAALAVLVCVGCADSGSTPPADTSSAATAPAETTPVELSADDLAQIDKLPEADRQAAKDQKVCVIAGEPLGSMGMPIKMEVDGHPVFLCCKGCEADFNADPKAALAKVQAAAPTPTP
jgi:hypothetical protein